VSPTSCPRFEGETPSTHGLLCQGYDFFWAERGVVDADVIDEAGEERSRTDGFAGADIQAAVGIGQFNTLGVK